MEKANVIPTQLILLGTGTPNADPGRAGSGTAIVVGNQAYLVDFGPGIVRRAAAAFQNGVSALEPRRLTIGQRSGEKPKSR